MSIIALFNLAKEYFEVRRTNQAFRRLDDHYLRDIGFYRSNGQIRPLAGSEENENKVKGSCPIPPEERPSDG